MTFATPGLLVALALLVPVLVAFLVRRRREVVRVSSTLLFRSVARSAAQSRRIRNLRRLVSLLACLAGVAGLVFAAARPTRRARGETVAFVVDASASMDAAGGATPFARARSFVARTLATAGPGDRYAIVAAGAVPTRLGGPAASGPALDAALRRLATERGSADLGAAVDLAAALVAVDPGARVVVLVDDPARAADLPVKARDVPVSVHVLAPGSRDNLGISVFATRPPADATGDDDREALVAVATSSDRERAARVIVAADGNEIADRRVTVPAKGEAEIRVRVRASATRLTARVAPADGISDALGRDDEAALGEASRALPRALLIAGCDGGGCADADRDADGVSAFFAEKALLAAGVREVLHVPAALEGREIVPGDVLVALERGPTRHVDAPALYLGTRSGALPVDGFRELTGSAAHLRSLATSDALLAGVGLDGVTIERAVATKVPASARALIDLDGGTVMLAGGAGASAWVYVGIEPSKSDLVLRVAFPVLVANALHVIGGAAQVVSADTVARAEIALGGPEPVAAHAEAQPPQEKDPPWRLPASPPALLAAVACLLLGLEAWAYRKGWAS